MIFLPTILITFIGFFLFLPFLFLMAYFNIITLGFEKLGISPKFTSLLLFLILIGSWINIPITKKQLIYQEKVSFFGLFRKPGIGVQATAINLGGGLIPILLSSYFLYKAWQSGFSLIPILQATLLMVIIAKSLAKIIPGKGIVISAFVPPIFAAFLAWIFIPNFMAPASFVIGSLGTLIGADLLNLNRAQKISPGFLSIGGGGVFDAIFLIGIVSTLLS
ncbi:MAG: DUF1614 domain-containing protein [Patescibacteria group bacterium]|nr:DUF1614 domain-containing protein [Patescibacteria group bacterium]MBU1877046.1 DUF1614 domain-containing protein [Patescibacteria group bacterium]